MAAARDRPMIRRALRWPAALIFTAQMYAMMALMAVVFTPWAAIDRRGAHTAVRTYCRWVRWSACVLVGLRSEVRGAVPDGEVLIAAKHQSFFDIIIICSVLRRPKFIMKKELTRAPILGWFARRMGCVAVDRGRKGQAIAAMLREVAAGRAEAGQLIIYPQGTRVAPGVKAPYKIGTAVLYEELGQPCIPAATNVGHFWPRHGLMRRPGMAVVAFLPPIPLGLSQGAFMARLEADIERASDAMSAEAGRSAA